MDFIRDWLFKGIDINTLLSVHRALNLINIEVGEMAITIKQMADNYKLLQAETAKLAAMLQARDVTVLNAADQQLLEDVNAQIQADTTKYAQLVDPLPVVDTSL